MRQSRLIMGTGVSIDIQGADESVFKEAFGLLERIDQQFSQYKEDSELSRYNRGEIASTDISNEFRRVMHACKLAESKTKGYFSAHYKDVFDPTGYVKGWAIAETGRLIASRGYGVFCVGIGGDILAVSDSDKIWGLGIINPLDKKSLTSKLFLKNGALATSGDYERGPHIISPFTKLPAKGFISVSIVGPDIVWADVLATACFAAGKKWRDVLSKNSGYEMLAIDDAGNKTATNGFNKLSNSDYWDF